MATAADSGKPRVPPQPVAQCSVRPRIDKLGIKPGFRVAVIDVEDAALMDELRTRTDQIVVGKPRDRRDAIFYAAESMIALEALESLKERIVASGAIWVVSRKGADRSLNDTDVIAAAKRAGLVDNKVVSFSPSHTALRLVIPLALRK
jgi:hypothetical protein